MLKVRNLASIACMLYGVAMVSAQAQEVREVSDGNARVEHVLAPGNRFVEFNLGWVCVGSNAPTLQARALINFLDIAAFGFIAPGDGQKPQWQGHRFRKIVAAYEAARPHMQSGFSDIRDGAAVIKFAKTQVALPGAFGRDDVEISSLVKVFRPTRVVKVTANASGGPRTVAISGCYSRGQIRSILNQRAAAASRLLRQAGKE